jgi:acid phosphatase type 7
VNQLNRRGLLRSALGGIAATFASPPMGWAQQPGAAPILGASTRPDTLFLTWQRDPTTTMTVQWIGREEGGEAPAISVARLGQDDWLSTPTRVRPFPMSNLIVFRSELTGLAPGAEYQFRIGTSPAAYRFRTMPARATDAFHFISGGDCGVNQHAVNNNIVAARQDPMFALIGGDLGYDNGTSPDVACAFIRNYSRTMTDSRGRLIPMVVCIGNHEVRGGYNGRRKDAPFFFALFDGLYAEKSYAALDFGDYLSLVLLDTGHVARIAGEQTDWLDRTLRERTERPHLIVVNHVPAYPSFRAADIEHAAGTGAGNRTHWVPLFEQHNVDVVLEHHDHTFKRTQPLKDGHVDLREGIVYLGDGSWGKLRSPSAPEHRSYLASASQEYHLSLHRLEGEQRFHLAMSETGRIMDVCTTRKRPRRRAAD